jgi:glycerol dehydrogenase
MLNEEEIIMISIKTPHKYFIKPDIIKDSGEFILPYGKRALIIAGKTALEVTGEDFLRSLRNSGISYDVSEFDSYVTLENIEKYQKLADEKEADLIIGLGGGRVLDLSKAIGERQGIPVVAVPTIAATCAAWSALTITYDNNGKFTGGILLEKSPVIVLADLKILVGAPFRYLAAGIGDTLVKWYESLPSLSTGSVDIGTKVGLLSAKLALDILYDRAYKAIESARCKEITDEFTEVVDSIIFLAGFVGSVNGGNHKAAIAHGVHNSLTGFSNTHGALHGEKVAFGLIVQFVLEGKSLEEINSLISFQGGLGLPVTLSDLGISEDILEYAQKIAEGINIENELLSKLPFEVSSSSLKRAIIKADELGSEWIKNKKTDFGKEGN